MQRDDGLKILVESPVFKAVLDGVDLSRCHIHFMGVKEPPPNSTIGGIVLSGNHTAVSIIPEAASAPKVYFRVHTFAARLPAVGASPFWPWTWPRGAEI